MTTTTSRNATPAGFRRIPGAMLGLALLAASLVATPASAAMTATAPPRTASVEAVADLPTAPALLGASSTDLYVSTAGKDSNPGTLAKPLRTIGRAASTASAGTTVWIRGGTYAGFEVTRSGLTFRNYSGERVAVTDSGRDDIIQFSGVSSGSVRGLVVRGSTAQYGSGIKIKDSSGVTVRASTIRDNRTFGIVIVRSSRVRIVNNRILRNADGIEERYAGDGVVIANNRIHHNTKMVDSGRGKEGINFYKSTGSVLVKNNRLWSNGTHFEIYGASNLRFVRNTMWNGQVMETGTDGPACNNNRFLRNVAYKGSGYQGGETNGMILRCASHNLVAHNTLDGFDLFALDIVDGSKGVAYGGSIAGLRVVNNIFVGGRAYSIDSALPSSVQIDYNLLYNVGSGAVYGNHLAYMKNVGQFDSISAFRSATGYERHGRFGNPRFANWAGHDYELRSSSPAIDRGLVVLSGSYSGSKPDLGRFEYH